MVMSYEYKQRLEKLKQLQDDKKAAGLLYRWVQQGVIDEHTFLRLIRDLFVEETSND